MTNTNWLHDPKTGAIGREATESEIANFRKVGSIDANGRTWYGLASVQFRGVTVRGREVVEATLEACVESLAFVANKPAPIVDRSAPHTWRLYASQAAFDVLDWFAEINAERSS